MKAGTCRLQHDVMPELLPVIITRWSGSIKKGSKLPFLFNRLYHIWIIYSASVLSP